jgi:hypothetical protein
MPGALPESPGRVNGRLTSGESAAPLVGHDTQFGGRVASASERPSGPFRRPGCEVSIRGSLRERLLDHRNGANPEVSIRGSLREQDPRSQARSALGSRIASRSLELHRARPPDSFGGRVASASERIETSLPPCGTEPQIALRRLAARATSLRDSRGRPPQDTARPTGTFTRRPGAFRSQ